MGQGKVSTELVNESKSSVIMLIDILEELGHYREVKHSSSGEITFKLRAINTMEEFLFTHWNFHYACCPSMVNFTLEI